MLSGNNGILFRSGEYLTRDSIPGHKSASSRLVLNFRDTTCLLISILSAHCMRRD